MPSAARIRKNNKNKKKRLKKILIATFAIIVVLTSAAFLFVNNMFGKMDQVKINEDDLGITDNSNKKITNIALFGIDTRGNSYDNSRTDSIMIATVDTDNKKIKLTSIMRDTYVSIPGKKYDKINHAYAYGGPELAIKTINTNFDMNIRDFVTVNFDAMERIVDAVGGVDIEISSAEATQISGISSGGLHTLNGSQAVDYSRIRNIGNADYERTERQRTVLENVLNKVLRDRSITRAMSLADSLLPYVQTSLSRSEILSLGTRVMTSGTSSIADSRLPLDEHSKGGLFGGVYYLKPMTLVDNARYLHEFIYENEDYSPSDSLMEISNKMP
ncbi:LCP family protein [Alkalibacter saccharofermentans]|uniref:Transcriptional attenuator, LytR family n=1 Tax=Alkalibacter saccharofermentans DSM 14828 TaxID=1120975 RepID=A0A1M5AAH6_9FIRM|nr:LCP family protein [Alkalibacter saccharofermentans]SHF27288.1 transcriptional attenuator, LytR family [Alkalibacter saccharofermentans DSM 14828]